MLFLFSLSSSRWKDPHLGDSGGFEIPGEAMQSLSRQDTVYKSSCQAASTNNNGWHEERVTDACSNVQSCNIAAYCGLRLLL